MDDATLERFTGLLATGQDSALLRLTLGQGYLARGEHSKAIEHLHQGVDQDPEYSALWKFLGKALEAAGDRDSARKAYESGLSVATKKGDRQLVRELQVFLKRLDRN